MPSVVHQGRCGRGSLPRSLGVGTTVASPLVTRRAGGLGFVPVVTGGDQGSQAGEDFSLDANLRLLLTKLSKKDTVTKFKALQELAPALEKVCAVRLAVP